MSRFSDLFQEPVTAPEQTPPSDPVKEENVVVEKPVTTIKAPKRKFTLD